MTFKYTDQQRKIKRVSTDISVQHSLHSPEHSPKQNSNSEVLPAVVGNGITVNSPDPFSKYNENFNDNNYIDTMNKSKKGYALKLQNEKNKNYALKNEICLKTVNPIFSVVTDLSNTEFDSITSPIDKNGNDIFRNCISPFKADYENIVRNLHTVGDGDIRNMSPLLSKIVVEILDIDNNDSDHTNKKDLKRTISGSFENNINKQEIKNNITPLKDEIDDDIISMKNVKNDDNKELIQKNNLSPCGQNNSILTTNFKKISPLSSPVLSSFGSPVNSEKSISNLNPNVDVHSNVNKNVKPSQNMQNNQNLQNIQNTEMNPNSLKLIQSMKFLNSPSASELHGKYDMESISFIKDLRRRKSEMSFNVNLIDQSKYVPLRRRSTGDMAENMLVLELEKNELINKSEDINDNKENVNENNPTTQEDEKISKNEDNFSSIGKKNMNEMKYIKEIHEIIKTQEKEKEMITLVDKDKEKMKEKEKEKEKEPYNRSTKITKPTPPSSSIKTKNEMKLKFERLLSGTTKPPGKNYLFICYAFIFIFVFFI